MAQKKINYGAAPNDGTGDLYRVAMIKIDDNFTDLYSNKVDKTATLALSGGATSAATALTGAATVITVTGLDMSKATAGTLAVARGGTGVTTNTGTGANVQAVSPALTGTPTAPTAYLGAYNTQIATTAFVTDTVQDNIVSVINALAIYNASETVSGKIKIATSTEAAAGTDNTRAITLAGLRSGLNASGSAPVFACRAWVNFNGTGTVAIRASGNVSSITDNSIGDYTVNFTTAMPDAYYCVNVSTERSAGFVNVATYANSSVRMYTYNASSGLADVTSAFASIFR